MGFYDGTAPRDLILDDLQGQESPATYLLAYEGRQRRGKNRQDPPHRQAQQTEGDDQGDAIATGSHRRGFVLGPGLHSGAVYRQARDEETT